MHGHIPFGTANAREIERQKATCPDEKVRVRVTGQICKACWPFKTAAHVATIIGSTERHASRIIAGEFECPPKLMAAVTAKMAE